jgi:hypothetical protein
MKINKQNIGGLLLCSLFATASASVFAQAPGSVVTSNGFSLGTGGQQTDAAETYNLGPGIYEINGTWILYSKNVWIHPAAQISGTGKIEIFNPSAAGGAANANLIDGNNNPTLQLSVDNLNASGWILTDLTDPGFNSTNPTGSKAAALKFTDNGSPINLTLGVDGANVTLNGNDFEVSSNVNIVNAGANRMVITGNTSNNKMIATTNNSTRLFPVGLTAGDYTPATINGTGTYNVSVVDYSAAGIPPVNSAAKGVNRMWLVYGSPASSVTLQHNAATNGSLFEDANGYITRHLSGGLWYVGTPEQVSTGIHTNAGTIATGIPTTLTDAAWLTKSFGAEPLPVDVLDFTAVKRNTQSILNWTTAHEKNNHGFDVQHSLDGTSWSSLGYVKTKAVNGNSVDKLSYNFTHAQPTKGNNYYRLIQQDLDGKKKTTKVAILNFDGNSVINVYPNPTTDKIIVSGVNENATIVVTDMLGKVLQQTKATSASVELNFGTYPNAAYFINVNNEGTSSTYKIVKAN